MGSRLQIEKYGAMRDVHAHDMYALLGVTSGTLPREGMPERVINGVRVYVKPVVDEGRRRNFRLRVTAICECGKHVPVGRLHQHKCKRVACWLEPDGTVSRWERFEGRVR